MSRAITRRDTTADSLLALVGAAAEMTSAFSGARKNRLDLSVGLALGSASQIALFVAPVLVLLR
jgi:Ca2+:H+ antiporter